MPGWRVTVAAAIAVVMFFGTGVFAQQADMVMAPLSFHGESGRIPIAACLQVRVRTYPDAAWWKSPASSGGAAEKALSAVLTALKSKNRSVLLELSEKPSAKAAKEFDTQVDTLLQQLAVLNVTSIPRAYEFDGFLVFVVRLQTAGGETIAAPFPFLLTSTGSALYLPARPEELTYALVQDLVGRNPDADASMCSERKARFTHRVSLGRPRPGASNTSPSALFLIGAPIGADTPPAPEPAQDVPGGVAALAKAAATGVDALAAQMTPQSAARLKKWWTTATEDERATFVTRFKDAAPFFVFDAAPLLVTYVKSAAGAVDVVYFLRQGGALVWTNAYRITVSDRVFKAGPLFEASSQASPFSKFRLK